MYPKGTRVQMHPATDSWMSGDKFGEVVGYGRYSQRAAIDKPPVYKVKLDVSGRVRRFSADLVEAV